MYLKHGLNKSGGGWRNWLKKNIGWVAPLATLINPTLGVAVGLVYATIETNDMSFYKTGSNSDDFDLTASEESILDIWSKKYFLPFYESLGVALNTAQILPNGAEKAFLLESIKNQICIAKSLGMTPTNGLSNNALFARTQLIDITLSELEKLIASDLIGYTVSNISIPQNKINLDLGIAQANTMVQCSSITFVVKGGAVKTIKDKQLLTDLTANLSDAFVQGTATNTNVAPEAVITKSNLWDTLKYPVYILGGYFLAKKAGIIK